jgi:hypothetical protein
MPPRAPLYIYIYKWTMWSKAFAGEIFWGLVMILFTTPCIDHFFQDYTETQKLLFSNSAIGKLWIVLTGLDAVFGSCRVLFWLVWKCVEQTWCVLCSSFPNIQRESDQSSPTYSAVFSPSILHSLNCLWPSIYELLQLRLDFKQLMATHLVYLLGGPSHSFLNLVNYSGTGVWGRALNPSTFLCISYVVLSLK